MKNVVLIDPCGTLYPIMLKLNKMINISLIYVDTNKIKSGIRYNHPHIEIYSGLDVVKWNKSWVSRDDIEKYRFIQLKCERYAGRFQVNQSYAMSQYYHGLAFWLSQFQEKNVDCVFIGASLEHGSPIDSIPMELAKYLKIPVFITEVHSAHTDVFKVIKCVNTGKHVDLSELDCTGKREIVNISEILTSPRLCDDTHIYDIIDNSDKPIIMKSGVKLIVNLSSYLKILILKLLSI